MESLGVPRAKANLLLELQTLVSAHKNDKYKKPVLMQMCHNLQQGPCWRHHDHKIKYFCSVLAKHTNIF